MRDADPIAFLTERLAAVETERDAEQIKAQRLERLQSSFVEIAKSASEEDLVRAALRGAWLGLGFARVFWFDVESEAAIATFELDGGAVVPSEYGGEFPEYSALRRIARADSDAATGLADDPDAPLFDTRRWYAAAAVRPGAGTSSIVYADSAVERAPSPWAVAALQELATQAALKLDNMRMAAELERLAMRDPLTGLRNRRALMDRLAAELAVAARTEQPLAFAMIDVDDFKRINDSRGHAGGDAALKAIADILRTQTRETDVPARFAGDEFSLIMPRTDNAAAEAVMLRIYAALRGAALSCSIGIAFSAAYGKDADALIAAADRAVYSAKAAGKNCYRFSYWKQ